MLSFEFLALSAALIGIGLTVNEILNAPEAVEDENGFSAIWVNNTPDRQDVSCVWTVAGHAA